MPPPAWLLTTSVTLGAFVLLAAPPPEVPTASPMGEGRTEEARTEEARTEEARTEEAPTGEELFLEQGCRACHSVQTAGIEQLIESDKVAGPDLSGVSIEDREAIRAYLRRIREWNGRDHGRKVSATDEELDRIFDWLENLPKPRGPGS